MTTRKREYVHEFGATEGAGATITVRGQCYRLDGFEQRLGKAPLALLSSECVDCGETFATKTPLRVSYLSRRCERHKQPGNKVHTHV